MDIKKHITFRHMEKSMVMEEHANKELARIEHFLANEPSPVFIELVLEASHVHEHPRIELRIKTPHYDEFVGNEYDGTPFYEALDNVLDTMYKKLLAHKQKRVDEKRRGV